MMYTQQELLDTINELEHSRHTIQNCEKLASLYTVLEHMFPDTAKAEKEYYSGYPGYSESSGKTQEKTSGQIGIYGDSEFLQRIAGKSPEDMWRLMDEVMTVLSLSDKTLYKHIIDRL